MAFGFEDRVVRTLPGLIHAICSLGALILGVPLLAICFVSFNALEYPTLLKSYFVCQFLSSSLVLLFFWNKFQTFYLSSTPRKFNPANFQVGHGIVSYCMM
jgi:hypothetical protein